MTDNSLHDLDNDQQRILACMIASIITDSLVEFFTDNMRYPVYSVDQSYNTVTINFCEHPEFEVIVRRK